MPDNPAPQGTPKPTPVPPLKKSQAGKVVVMLSSVAKAVPGSVPAPAKPMAPAEAAAPPTDRSTLTGPINVPPTAKATPPPLPTKPLKPMIRAPAPARSDSKVPGNKRTAPIKLNLPATPAPVSEDSIFLTDEPPAESHPAGWKELEPGELQSLKGDLQSLDVFSRSSKPAEIKTPGPAAPAKVEEKSPVPVSPPPADLKAPEAKSPVVAKAPETPPSPIPVKPMVHLPPVVAPSLPTTAAPPVVLVSPSPALPGKPPARPPPLPSRMPLLASVTPPLLPAVKLPEKTDDKTETPPAPEPLPAPQKSVLPEEKPLPEVLPLPSPQAQPPPLAEVKPPAPVEPATFQTAPPLLRTDAPALVEVKPPVSSPSGAVHTVPPLLKSEPSPVVEAKLPDVKGPDAAHVVPPLLKTEASPIVEAKLPEVKEPEPLHVAPPLLKTEGRAAHKLPPRLPSPQPVSAPEVPAKVAEPENKAKPPPLPLKAAPPSVPPVLPVEAKAVTAPAAPPLQTPVETKTEPGPATKPEQKPEAPLPVKEPQVPLAGDPSPSGQKIEHKPGTVTGPISVRDLKPALKPPVLPARLARMKEQESAAPPVQPSEESTTAPPLVVEARASEPEKLKPPVLPDEKASVPVVPPLIEAKPSESEKLKAPVKVEEKPPAAKVPSEVSPARPAEPEKPKSSLRLDPKSSALPVTATAPAGKKTLPEKEKPVVAADPALTPRAARARKKRLWANFFFYTLCVALPFALYYVGGYYCHETRLEGQVIPPVGMLLGDEVWIVTDFRDEAAREAEDLADKRAPALQDIQEKLNHVQRAQADIAAREERVRLLQGQIQAAKDEVDSIVKQAKDAAQQLWDGPGAQIDKDYDAREQGLSQTISDRAKALKLDYQPDPNFNSPEVWANAYRLALYQAPTGVDSAKELLWLDDQMKQWRDFTKSVDDRKEQIREQVAAVKQSPAGKVTDLQTQIDDLQHRIDSTSSEEMPLKTELQQAQADLAQTQATETGLDTDYYNQLYSIPESDIRFRLPLAPNGRFSWRTLEKDTPFVEGATAQSYWLFARAVRTTDGRQYWALSRITVDKDSTFQVVIEPEAFISTKAILRPDLPPDEQQQ